MTRIQKAKDTASGTFLGLWGSVPNPNRDFFKRAGISFDQVMRDISSVAEVEAGIIARKNAVIADEWQIVGQDEKVVEFITDNIKKIGTVYIFNSIFDAIWHGYAVLDVPMIKIGGKWQYENIDSLPQEWFAFNKERKLVFTYESGAPINLSQGDIEKEAELIQYYPSYANPYGESQLARVFWPSTWFKGNMEYWASYITRFGDDSILAHTDAASEDKKNKLLQAIRDFRSSGGMVVEGTDTFELLNTNKNGSSMLFKDFSQACKESISKIILGHASALDSTPGKLGGEDNVALVREDIQQGDKRLIEDVMNSLIRHLCLLNKTEVISFVWVPEAEDERAKIERDKKLFDMGVRFTPEYIQDAYRLPEESFKIVEAATASQIPAFAEPTTMQTSKKKSEEYTKPLDDVESKRFKAFLSPFNKYNKRLLEALEKAEYWEDAFEALLTTPLTPAGEDFQQDLLNAQIIGRGQVLNTVAAKKGTAEFADEDINSGVGKYLDTKATARNWFTKKTTMTAEEFSKLDDELKQYAFTVSGLEKTEHISAVAQKLTEAFDKGQSYTTFKKSLDGLGTEIDSLAENRLQMVYRQNMFAAYSEGRYKQMIEAKDILPNWEYITIGDNRVRPSHAALNGTVRRYDDPFWKSWYPPNGFGCRCVAEVTNKEPTGEGVPSWNKDLADKAMEAGSPMTEVDRFKGSLMPDKGFALNNAAMSRWIGEKGEEAIKKSLALGVDEVSKIGIRRQLLKSTETPIKWDESKNIVVKENITQKNAVEIVEKQVNKNGTILDFDGSPIFVSPKDIIKHITNEFDIRKDILPKIKETLQNPVEAWGQFEKYKGKDGTIVFAKKYLTRINGEEYMLVAEYIKKGKDTSMPYLTTVYKINTPNILREKRTGIRLK